MFSDPTVHSHDDPRVPTVVAVVPAAARIDIAAHAAPRMPLGLVNAR